jgi:flagellar hook-associated protein 2
LTRDTAAVKEKINAFVTAYNEINQVLNEVTKADSTLDIYGGTLVGDSVARQVSTQLREMVTGVSSSPGTNIGALWQMGLNVDRLGVMTVDKTKLDAALTDNFADVVTMFTANQNNRTETSPPISTSTGFSGKFTQLNSGSAFSLSLVSSAGTVEIPIPVGSTTPQGIVDAIIAANLGYTAAIVKDPADNTQYKIMVAGGMGSAGFTLTAADDAGASIAGLSFSGQGAGIAGDALRKISALLSPTGGLLTRSESASTQNDKFRERLATLQTRMQTLLDRYTRQFAAMESLVGSINSQKTSLQSSFDGMMAMYTNK